MLDGEQDRLTLAAFVAREPGAARAFVRRHEAVVHGFATRLLGGDASAADDVAQETFIAALRHGDRYDGRGSVRGWLLAIARHACARRRRRRAGEPLEHEALDALGAEAGWGADDPEALATQAEVRDRLERALLALSSDDREVLLLRDVAGLTGAEAARALEVDLGAMKSRLHRARLRLSAAYRKEGRHGRRA